MIRNAVQFGITQRQNFFRRPFGIVAAQRRVVISGARQNLPFRRLDVGQTGNIVRPAGRGLHNGLFRQAQRNRYRGGIVFLIVKLLPAQYRILIAFDDTQRPAVGIYSGLNLNQYGVASPCRTICTVCGFVALS